MSFGIEDLESEGGGVGVGFETMRGRDWPSVRQFNVFLANRMGALLESLRDIHALVSGKGDEGST